MNTSSGEHPTNKKSLGIIFLTIVVDLIGFSIIFPLFPAMLEFYLPHDNLKSSLLYTIVTQLDSFSSWQGTDSRLLATVVFGGVVGSVYSIIQFISTPLWGRLSDRFGRRPILIITILGNSISYLIWAFSANFWAFLASRIIAGTMCGNISVANAAVADLTSKKNRSQGMAIVGVAFGLGFIFGPALGGFMSQFNLLSTHPEWLANGIHPFTMAALAGCFLSVINLIWVSIRFEESLPIEHRRSFYNPKHLGRIEQILRTKVTSIRRTYLVNFIHTIVLSGMEFTLVFLAVERFMYSPQQNGWIFVYIGFILLFTQGYLVRKHLFPKWGEKYTLLSGIALGSLAYAAIAIAYGEFSFYIGLTLLGISTGFITPSLSALVSLYATEKTQGKYLGSFRSVGALARAIGPFLGAMLYFLASSKWYYMMNAWLMVLPLIFTLKLPVPSHEEAPTLQES